VSIFFANAKLKNRVLHSKVKEVPIIFENDILTKSVGFKLDDISITIGIGKYSTRSRCTKIVPDILT